MIKVGDIIDGKRVTKVYTLCGGIAYQSEPVEEENSVKVRRSRKKEEKEQ